MPLSVSCPSCGQTYSVKDELAGKKFRCQHCQSIVAISDDMVLAEEAEPDPILPAALLSSMASPTGAAPTVVAPAVVAPTVVAPTWGPPTANMGTFSSGAPAMVRTTSDFGDLEFKTKPRIKPPTPQQVSSSFLMWLFGVSGLFLAIYTVAMMISFQWGLAVLLALLLPGVIGLGITSQIGLFATAFREDVTCGVRCIFLPVYYLYYLISRWRYLARYGWMMVVQAMVIVVALIVPFMVSPPRETAQERPQRILDKNMELIDKSLEGSGIEINPPNSAPASSPPTFISPTSPEAIPSSSPMFLPPSSPDISPSSSLAGIPPSHQMPSIEEIRKDALERHQKMIDDMKARSRERSNRQRGVNTPPASPTFDSPPYDSSTRVTATTPSMLHDSQVEANSKLASKSSELKPKQKVFVKWGGTWYECEIVDLADKEKPKIHYMGWSDSWDEQVPLDRVRIPNP